MHTAVVGSTASLNTIWCILYTHLTFHILSSTLCSMAGHQCLWPLGLVMLIL